MIGIVKQEAMHQRQGIRRDFGIGVEQQHGIGAGRLDADIVAAAIPGVQRLRQQFHLGEFGARHVRAAIGRGVIDHDDFQIEPDALPQ